MISSNLEINQNSFTSLENVVQGNSERFWAEDLILYSEFQKVESIAKTLTITHVLVKHVQKCVEIRLQIIYRTVD